MHIHKFLKITENFILLIKIALSKLGGYIKFRKRLLIDIYCFGISFKSDNKNCCCYFPLRRCQNLFYQSWINCVFYTPCITNSLKFLKSSVSLNIARHFQPSLFTSFIERIKNRKYIFELTVLHFD